MQVDVPLPIVLKHEYIGMRKEHYIYWLQHALNSKSLKRKIKYRKKVSIAGEMMVHSVETESFLQAYKARETRKN